MLRAVLALVAFIAMFVGVAFFLGIATGAIAAPADKRAELLTAAECADLPMRVEAFGLYVGQLVRTATWGGQLMSFACVESQAGALVFVSPREGSRAVKVSELVRP